MENIDSIGRNLWINNNDALSSLIGLENIISIGGHLMLRYNDALSSLSGLDNIDYKTITSLTIENCQNLSVCEVQSICGYLQNDSGNAQVSDNAHGCNSVLEIEAACLVPAREVLSPNDAVYAFPNPTNNIVYFEGIQQDLWYLRVINTMGEIINSHTQIENRQVDLSNLPSDIFILELSNKDQFLTMRIIKE